MSTRYDLYVITDEGLSKGHTHAEIARMAIAGGADAVQLRDKRLCARELLQCAMEIGKMAKSAGVLFIVNDRLDIALASGADGVHLGQGDLPASLARAICPPGFIIGVSAGTPGEAIQAERDGADYVGLGPIFNTSSKSDAGPACGPGMIREVKKNVLIPVVAIGGIGPANAKEVLLSGADGLAVISAVVSQDDVELAARRLKSLIVNVRNGKVHEG